ncbi:MAG TPA: hypothetical protein VGD80_15215 [Kofleriaceae bacterium]
MRKLPLGVAVSTALHAAAFIWVGWVSARPDAPATRRVEPSTTAVEIIHRAPVPPAPEIEPIEATLLDPPSPASTTPARPAPRSPSPSPAAIVAPGAGADAGSRAETAPTRSPLLTMRGKEPPRLALPAGRWDPLDRVPAGTAPEKQRTTGSFHNAGRGTYESDQDGFIGKVKPDGTVTLEDKPSASIHIALPSPKDIGRFIAQWYEAPKGDFGETVEAPMSKHLSVSIGPTTDPGDEAHPEHTLKDKAATVIVPIIGGRLEVTDWLMRSKGIDPYASRKLKLLDTTRDERVQIGNRHRAQQLAMTPQIVQRNLTHLWAATPDTAARKQALFDLWDECAETGDPAVVAAADAARRLVIAFIRTHLPAGGPDAFTPAELDALTRTKRSRAAFQPYDERDRATP